MKEISVGILLKQLDYDLDFFEMIVESAFGLITYHLIEISSASTDLLLAPQKCSVQSYVDYIKASYVVEGKSPQSFKMKDVSETFANLRDDLHRICQWCSNNLLMLR